MIINVSCGKSIALLACEEGKSKRQSWLHNYADVKMRKMEKENFKFPSP